MGDASRPSAQVGRVLCSAPPVLPRLALVAPIVEPQECHDQCDPKENERAVPDGPDEHRQNEQHRQAASEPRILVPAHAI